MTLEITGTISRTSDEEPEVKAITASDARQRLFPIIREIVEDDVVIHVTSKHGTIVMMSEAQYGGIMETMYLLSTPVNAAALFAAKADAEAGRNMRRIDPQMIIDNS